MFQSIRPGAALLVATILSCAAALTAGSATAQNNDRFNWPTTVVHLEPEWNVHKFSILGVMAVVPEDVRATVLKQTYTPEERRNVQAAIDDMAKPMGTPPRRSKEFRPFVGPAGFYALHTAFIDEFNLVPRSNDGYSVYSFMGRVQTIEQIVAKGNRVAVSFRITGSVAGPMFGIKGAGQLINVREQIIYEFDKDGLILTYLPWSGDDMPLYTQLGGTLQFEQSSSRPALTVASPTVAGSPLPPASAAEVRAVVEAVDYSVEERRNIQTLLDALAHPNGLEDGAPGNGSFCRQYKKTDSYPYLTLDQVRGSSDGFRLDSFKGLKRQVTDIIAKGDQAWVHFVTTGKQTGPLFGAPSTGKSLTWNEQAFITFDQAGKICEAVRQPVQGEIYLQLGGKYTFPYGKYWKCDSCPFGIATMNIPGEHD